jgi:hypothetical protein
MEPDELAPNQITAKTTKSSWTKEAWTVAGVLLVFASAEGIFLIQLWPLIRSKASLNWAMPAGLFQMLLISSAISFRRCLRLGPKDEEGKKQRQNFESQMVGLVLALILAMIFLSEVTSAYDKVKP